MRWHLPAAKVTDTDLFMTKLGIGDYDFSNDPLNDDGDEVRVGSCGSSEEDSVAE